VLPNRQSGHHPGGTPPAATTLITMTVLNTLRRQALPLLITLNVLGGPILETPHTASASTAPAVLWGAYITDGQADTSLLDAFESRAGKKLSIVHWGEEWMIDGAYGTFPTTYVNNVRNHGSIPMITWESWNLGDGPTQPNFTLSKIADGTHDAFIKRWAQSAKTWGKPFFLRLDHEMNGAWQFPWSEQLNGNHPGDYVRAWRHVHDIFTSVGATNATWVWCPNVSDNSTLPLNGLYPGDAYVDWTCFDGYNRGTGTGDSWQTFAQVFGGSAYGGYDPHNSYQEMLSIAPSKPMMLGEIGSVENGGSKASWISDMLHTQLLRNFPQVKAFVWTDQAFDGYDWPIESSPSAQTAFAQGIGSSYYAANTFGSIASSPIPALAPAGGAASAPGTVVLNPVADTYTARSAPDSTTGGSTVSLRADVAGTDTAFLRFDLSGLRGKTIGSATLRLHSSAEHWAASRATFDVTHVDSTDWKEAWMSYDNSVPISSTLLGSLAAPTQPDTWYSVKLALDGLQPNAAGLVSFAIFARSGDVLIVNSRESGSATAPQLVVSYQ
jgi:hypothetical protein